MLKRLLGGGGPPQLVTAVVTTEKQGTLGVMYLCSPEDGKLKDSGGYASIEDLVGSVERALTECYGAGLPERGIDLQLTWYPFGENDKRKGRKLGLPQDFMVFEARQMPDGGFVASLQREGPPFADALRLGALPARVHEAAQRAWPALAGTDPPGMIRWGRRLTDVGFVPEDPFPAR